MNNSVTSCSPYAVPNLYDLQQQQQKGYFEECCNQTVLGTIDFHCMHKIDL